MQFVFQSSIYMLLVGSQICNEFPTLTNALQIPVIDQAATASQHEALIKAGVIPDVLDDFEPSVSINIVYPKKNKTVTLGNSIKPKHVGSQPTVDIAASGIIPSRTLKDNATYVLVLTDPDATSRSDPKMAQMCHWIATNVSVSSDLTFASESERSTPKDLIEYLPPTPPPKTSYHRYVFVVLVSDSDDDLSLTKPKERPHWGYGRIGAGVREWAGENGLVVVGANFFYSKNKKQ